MNDLVVFTDGSCTKNGSIKAAAATVWPNAEFADQAFYLEPTSMRTNNRAEFLAATRAGEQADIIDPGRQKFLHIYTDSMLLVNTVTKLAHAWRKKA